MYVMKIRLKTHIEIDDNVYICVFFTQFAVDLGVTWIAVFSPGRHI